MNKILTTFMLLVLAHCVYAGDEECPAAVDAAEAQNHNLYKNCDYSDKGLNGVLHRALAGKNKEANEDEPSRDTKAVEPRPAADKSQKTTDKNEAQKTGEFASAQQLQLVKLNALENLAQECTKGFVVEGERYLPVINSKAMKLELIYHCL